MGVRTDSLPSVSEVLSSDEVLGNFNGSTGRTPVSTLLNAFYIIGTNEPDATTEGKFYIQIDDIDNSIVNVYIKIGEDWVVFPKGGGGGIREYIGFFEMVNPLFNNTSIQDSITFEEVE